jgi:hypothetical protein
MPLEIIDSAEVWDIIINLLGGSFNRRGSADDIENKCGSDYITF